MVPSVATLFMTAAVACVVFSTRSVAEGKDLPSILRRLQHAVRPRHCGHLRLAGQTSSGVYTIYHNAASESGQRVYCDMETDGGDWTVIQKRGQYGNSIFYFYRNWTEYASGFGSPDKEYWIGLRALHALTSSDDQMSLRVELSQGRGESVSFDYGIFQIASEDDLFRIRVGDFKGTDGFDALWDANGLMFSTFDRNNSGEYNCAEMYKGAWWHKVEYCSGPNLNGVNFNGGHEYPGDGIHWGDTVSPEGVDWDKYSYPSVRMMIRPTGGLQDRRWR